jgi:hypothetical protein
MAMSVMGSSLRISRLHGHNYPKQTLVISEKAISLNCKFPQEPVIRRFNPSQSRFTI